MKLAFVKLTSRFAGPQPVPKVTWKKFGKISAAVVVGQLVFAFAFEYVLFLKFYHVSCIKLFNTRGCEFGCSFPKVSEELANLPK